MSSEANHARPEGADRSRPSLETTKGEDGSELRSHLTEILYGLENLRGWWPNGKLAARDAWLNHITRHARRASALTDQAGELVRLRDSQQTDLEAFTDAALARRMLCSIAFDAERLNQDGLSPRLTAIQIRDKALLALGVDDDEALRVLRGEHVFPATSSSVSPSLTETGMGSGQTPPAPDGEAAA